MPPGWDSVRGALVQGKANTIAHDNRKRMDPNSRHGRGKLQDAQQRINDSFQAVSTFVSESWGWVKCESCRRPVEQPEQITVQR